MNKKPVIVVTSEHGFSAANMGSVPLYILDKAYSHAITAAGGIPITPLGPCMEDRYCEMADGLLLTGGSNIHSGRYNTPFIDQDASYGISYHRDNIEFDLFKAFFEAGKPIMGICRGNQLINVALGGTLVQDLMKVKGTEHSDGSSQQINAEPDSILEKLYGKEFQANTFHRQAIDKLGAGLKITAYAQDGIPEALEHETKPVFSVQFRPELMCKEAGTNFDGPDMISLFEYFVNLCRDEAK